MLRLLSAVLLATAASVAPMAAMAHEGSGEELGVMSISLADVVKPTIEFQGSLQGAGTPNQAGMGGSLPMSVGENSVWFLLTLGANLSYDEAFDASFYKLAQGTATTMPMPPVNTERKAYPLKDPGCNLPGVTCVSKPAMCGDGQPDADTEKCTS